jgi:hypothetical protein
MLFNITVSVLAIVVPLLVAGVSLMFVLNAQSKLDRTLSERCSQTSQEWKSSYAELRQKIALFEVELAKSTNTHLAAEVAATAAELDALAKSCRKQFGRLFAEWHHEGGQKRANSRQRDLVDDDDLDPEFIALVQHQSADPVKPTNGSA